MVYESDLIVWPVSERALGQANGLCGRTGDIGLSVASRPRVERLIPVSQVTAVIGREAVVETRNYDGTNEGEVA
jgi:hypothetical protein